MSERAEPIERVCHGCGSEKVAYRSTAERFFYCADCVNSYALAGVDDMDDIEDIR